VTFVQIVGIWWICPFTLISLSVRTANQRRVHWVSGNNKGDILGKSYEEFYLIIFNLRTNYIL
jgi:hypothetical protein